MIENAFGQFQQAKAEEDAARQLYNYSGQKLENAGIRRRLAEAKSQAEPIASLVERTDLSERERLYALAFWVVVGRLPEELKTP